MSARISLRQATPLDAPVIAEFNALLAEETEHLELDRPLLRAGVAAVLADPAKGIYWVAEAEATVVGQLLITLEWSDWRNGYFWWIQSVYVRPDWRGRDVFRSLYEFVRKQAEQRSDVCGLRLYVDADNVRAKQTYARLGLRPTSYQVYELDFRLAR